jgi:HlyD family secretion protein
VKQPDTKRIRRWARMALGGLALLAVIYVAFRADPLLVETAPVTRGSLEVTVDEEGETRVRKRYVMAAPTTGRLLRIELDEGDEVEAGAVLAHIQPVPLDARALAGAQARLEAAQATKRSADAEVALTSAALEQAQRNTARANQLLEAGTLSTEDAGNATQDGNCAGASCFHVNSPIDGRVLRVREESERIVAAGTPLIEVGDASKIEIVVDVLSTDAVRVQPGAVLRIEDWGGSEPLEARVRIVEPSGFTKISALGVEEQRVNVIADLVTPAPSLGDGYRVEARIVVWEADDVLRVPASALFRRGKRWNVFTLEEGRARLRPIEIGERGATQAQVLDGLSEGEQVLLHPSDRVEDGVRATTSN